MISADKVSIATVRAIHSACWPTKQISHLGARHPLLYACVYICVDAAEVWSCCRPHCPMNSSICLGWASFCPDMFTYVAAYSSCIVPPHPPINLWQQRIRLKCDLLSLLPFLFSLSRRRSLPPFRRSHTGALLVSFLSDLVSDCCFPPLFFFSSSSSTAVQFLSSHPPPPLLGCMWAQQKDSPRVALCCFFRALSSFSSPPLHLSLSLSPCLFGEEAFCQKLKYANNPPPTFLQRHTNIHTYMLESWLLYSHHSHGEQAKNKIK